MWPFKKDIYTDEEEALIASPKLDYDPKDMLLQKWDMRGRYAMTLGFGPGEDFEKITGYKHPKELLVELSKQKPPFSDRYKILTELAIAEYLLFGKDEEKDLPLPAQTDAP